MRLRAQPLQVSQPSPATAPPSSSQAVDAKSTRFASEDEVKRVTGCVPGAVPPFGSCFGLRTFVDESLRKQGDTINFNAGLRTFSVSMTFDDYFAVEKPTEVKVSS